MWKLTCTFFGQSNVPQCIETLLEATLIELIEKHKVDTFYIGNHGGFDFMVYKELKKLVKVYPYIKRKVVLAYLPSKNTQFEYFEYIDTIVPNRIEFVPKRFAINYRNKWMLENSDYVVTFVGDNIVSRSAKFKEMAEKKNKIVINITKAT